MNMCGEEGLFYMTTPPPVPKKSWTYPSMWLPDLQQISNHTNPCFPAFWVRTDTTRVENDVRETAPDVAPRPHKLQAWDLWRRSRRSFPQIETVWEGLSSGHTDGVVSLVFNFNNSNNNNNNNALVVGGGGLSALKVRRRILNRFSKCCFYFHLPQSKKLSGAPPAPPVPPTCLLTVRTEPFRVGPGGWKMWGKGRNKCKSSKIKYHFFKY